MCVVSEAKLFPRPFLEALEDGEEPMALARARVPVGGRYATGVTFFSVGTILRIVDLLSRRRQLQRLRRQSQKVGFPLDQRMILAVTDRRLLIAKDVRGRRPVILGEVPRADIVNARLPYLGDGWKLLELMLTGDRGVRLFIDRADAQGLIATLSNKSEPS